MAAFRKAWFGIAVFAGCLWAADAVEEIVAKVNGSIVTRSELLQRADQSHASLADALSEEIDELLLVGRAKELGINVDGEVNRKLADLQRESGLAEPEAFHEWLLNRTGKSFEDVKEWYRDGLLAQRVAGEEVYRKIAIPRAERERYYELHKAEFVRQESVSVSEILISTEHRSAAEAEDRAREMAERLRKGEKFADLAGRYSDNPFAAREGGSLGRFTRNSMAKPLEDAVFGLSKGSVTEPIRVASGFEILRVDERTAAGQETLDEAGPEIEMRLMEPLAKPKLRAYLTDLRRNAFLQIREGYADSGAAPGQDTSWQAPAVLMAESVRKEDVAARHRARRFLGLIP
jgi:parvulin-like peptidyl-prolyl isomerase